MRRVFKGHPDAPTAIYGVGQSQDVQEDELTVFLQQAKTKMPEGLYQVLDGLAHRSPALRLTVNLKALLGLMYQNKVVDVFHGGVTQQERAVLVAIQIGGFTPRMQEIGHELLCISDRTAFINDWGAVFEDWRTRVGGYIGADIARQGGGQGRREQPTDGEA